VTTLDTDTAADTIATVWLIAAVAVETAVAEATNGIVFVRALVAEAIDVAAPARPTERATVAVIVETACGVAARSFVAPATPASISRK
jgi:hypothetical protein